MLQCKFCLRNEGQLRNIYIKIWPKYHYAHLCGTETFILIDSWLDPMAVTEIVKEWANPCTEFYQLPQLRSLSCFCFSMRNCLRDCWYLQTQTSAKWEQKYITAGYFHPEMLLDLQSWKPYTSTIWRHRFNPQKLSSTAVTDLFSFVIFFFGFGSVLIEILVAVWCYYSKWISPSEAVVLKIKSAQNVSTMMWN